MNLRIFLYLILVGLFLIVLKGAAQTENYYNSYNWLQEHINQSDYVFEGYYTNKNVSFLDKRQLFTLMSFKVTRMIKGKMPADSIIKIEVDGGRYFDPQTGIEYVGLSAHGNGIVETTNALIFLYPKNERNNHRIKLMIDISNPEKLSYNCIPPYEPQPYVKLEDLYRDISSITGNKFIIKKKT
ncbi:MAG: hypothetical protein KatS3mg027_0741 [Bacteroidia bacterium]|nr:MAG: hypothetical protein KatS3mg027_0741 [Bacteroidia bacterium]